MNCYHIIIAYVIIESIKAMDDPKKTLFLFSVLMMILPLGTYFGIRHYVDSTTVSAMGAIVMVQIIVAAYIYKAWNDENKEHKKNIKEKLKKR